MLRKISKISEKVKYRFEHAKSEFEKIRYRSSVARFVKFKSKYI